MDRRWEAGAAAGDALSPVTHYTAFDEYGRGTHKNIAGAAGFPIQECDDLSHEIEPFFSPR